jgi:Ca2+:H+ antiporter
VLIPMATLVMVVPNYLVSAPGPYYSPLQLAFVSAVCLGLYIAFLFIQTGWHRAYFLPIGEEGTVGHARPSGGIALASLGMLLVALLSVVLLALEAGVQTAGAPLAIVSVIIAAIVLLPETAAAIRAAARRQLQASINLSLGSAIASIGLSVLAVAFASFWIGQPLELGISAGASVLMALSFVVAIITCGTGGQTCCPASSTRCCWQPTSSRYSRPDSILRAAERQVCWRCRWLLGSIAF